MVQMTWGRQIAETGRYPTFSFGQQRDQCQTIFRKFFTTLQTMRSLGTRTTSPSGLNVSVTLTPNMPGWNEETSDLPTPSGPRNLVAKTDADSLQLLNPTTLEPLLATTYKQLDPRLDGPLSAAHSCRDQETGDFYNYSCKFGGQFPTYKIFRIGGKDGKVDMLAEIKDAPPSYIHSFAMMERFIMLCVWQAHMKQCVHNATQMDVSFPICRHPRSSASTLSTPSTTQLQMTPSLTCWLMKKTRSLT